MRFSKWSTYLLLAVSLTFASSAYAQTTSWTVMIYMNAKNNLESDAIANFREIAATGSSKDVNVVVEMGRPKTHVTTDAGGWSGVLRFRASRNQEPVPANAIVDLRKKTALSDMGSFAALQDFVVWSVRNYPAKKYMLVIWNHGQGWRFQMAADSDIRLSSALGRLGGVSTQRQLATKRSTPTIGGFRAASFDDDTGHYLYNSDIEQATQEIASKIGHKIDVIGFDACLMSMAETAYAFRNSAAFLVSSEELEPGAGWDYVPIVRSLVANPAISGRDLGRLVVDSYRGRYGDYHNTTMALVDLTKIDALANSVSQFGDALHSYILQGRVRLKKMRSTITAFGADDGLSTSVDLGTLAQDASRDLGNPRVSSAAGNVLNSLSSAVIYDYAGKPAASTTNAKGLAIYFPASKSDFENDPFHAGYLKDNHDHPVEFVQKTSWSGFLDAFLK